MLERTLGAGREACNLPRGLPRGHERHDGGAHRVGFVGADGMAAVLENAERRAGDEGVDFLGELGRANPVVAAGENQRGSGDAAEVRAQVVAAQEAVRAKGTVDRLGGIAARPVSAAAGS